MSTTRDRGKEEQEIGIPEAFCGKPKFISLPVSPPKVCKVSALYYGPKYNNFRVKCTAISVLCFCFFPNPEVEIMLNMVFNTLLTICKNEEEEKKEQHMDLYNDIRSYSLIQFLTPTDRALLECCYQTKFHQGCCKICISSMHLGTKGL